MLYRPDRDVLARLSDDHNWYNVKYMTRMRDGPQNADGDYWFLILMVSTCISIRADWSEHQVPLKDIATAIVFGSNVGQAPVCLHMFSRRRRNSFA